MTHEELYNALTDYSVFAKQIAPLQAKQKPIRDAVLAHMLAQKIK